MATKNTISTRISLEGGAEIKKLLAELGKAGEKAFASIKEAADKSGSGIGTKFTASLAKFKRDLASLQTAGQRFGVAFGHLGTAFSRFGTSLTTVATRLGLVTTAALGAAAAFFKLGQSAIDTVDSADRASQALGLTIEEYSGLSSAAAQSSISSEELGTALTRLNVLMGKGEDAAGGLGDGLAELDTGWKHLNENHQKASASGEKSISVLQKLGIATKNSKGELRSARDVLFDLADAFQKMPDGAEKTTIAVQALGRGGARLIPFLNQGSAGLRQIEDDARRMGTELTQADKKVAALADNGLDRLDQAIKGARLQLGLLFAPAIGAGSNFLANFIRDNLELIKEFGRVIVDQGIVLVVDFIEAFHGFDDLVDNKWVITLRDGIIAFGAAVTDVVYGIVIPAFTLLREGAQFVADTINKYFGTDFSANQILVIALVAKLSGALALLGAAAGIVTAAANLFLAVWAPIAALLPLLVSGFGLLWTGLKLLVVGLAAIVGLPVTVTAAIVAAVAAAAALIFVYWDEIVAAAEAAWEAIKNGAGPAFDAVKAALAEGIEGIKVLFGGITASAKVAFASLKQGLAQDINEIKDILAIEVIDPKKFEPIVRAATAAFGLVKKTLAEDIGEIQDILAIEVVSASTWDKFVTGTAEAFANIKRDLKVDINEIKDILDVQVFNPDTFWGDIRQSATDIWNGVEGIISAAATNIGLAVGAVARAAMEAWTGASASVAASAQAILDAITKASDIAGNVAGATLLAQALVAPFIEAKGQIETVLGEIAAASTEALAGVVTAFQEAMGALPVVWQEIINQMVAAATGAASALVTPFAAAASEIVAGWQGMIGALDSALLELVNRTESLLARLASQLASLRAAIASAQSAAGGGGRGLARGGPVHGPGTSTSDSIPAWLSSGEFVVRAAAVDKVGPSFLQMINSGRFSLEELLRRFSRFRMPKLNMGGLINMPAMTMPRFAEGGLVPAAAGSSGSPVYLRFGNDTVGPMQATADVVSTLMRHAVRENTLSAGRKPGRG